MPTALSEIQRELLERISVVDVTDLCVKCAGAGCWVVRRSVEILQGNEASYTDFVDLGGGVRMGAECKSEAVRELVEEFKFT